MEYAETLGRQFLEMPRLLMQAGFKTDVVSTARFSLNRWPSVGDEPFFRCEFHAKNGDYCIGTGKTAAEAVVSLAKSLRESGVE